MTSHYTSSSLNAHGRHYAQQISRPGPTTLSLQARRLERRTATPSRFGVNAPVCRGTLLRKHIWRYLLSRRGRSVGCFSTYLPICPFPIITQWTPTTYSDHLQRPPTATTYSDHLQRPHLLCFRKHIWRYLLSCRGRSVGRLRKYLPICPYCLVSFLSPFLTLRGRFVASLVTLGVHATATTLGCYFLLTRTLQLRYTLPYLPLVYIPMYTYTDIQREREISPAALM